MNFMHACKFLHAHNKKFYRGINYFRGGPNISEIFGPGGPNIMGVQIFCYKRLSLIFGMEYGLECGME